MEPTKQLADEIFRERVRRARAMAPEDKLCAGIELFEQACERMRDGIRMQFPSADGREVERILPQRIQAIRKAEDYGIYRPIDEKESLPPLDDLD